MKVTTIVMIFFSLVCLKTAIAQDSLIMGIAANPDGTTFKIANRVVQEISLKMGVDIQLHSFPGKRATIMLRNGQIFGELSRIYSYKETVPSAIRVEEPIISLTYYVYAVNTNFQVNGWHSLKPYKIVMLAGLAIHEHYLKDHVVHNVYSLETAFHFLKKKRADILISNSITADYFLNSSGFNKKDIIKLEPPIDTVSEYTFISSKYLNLAEKYHHALVEIKKDGTFNKIFEEIK